VLEASFLELSDRSRADGAVSVWPAWEVRDGTGTTSWFHVRLAFPDGARVDALAVFSDGRVGLEDVRARPALSLDALAALAGWIEGPLTGACGPGGRAGARGEPAAEREPEGEGGPPGEGALEDGEPLREDGAPRDGGLPGDSEAAHGPAAGADETHGEPCARRRARPAWPRGAEGRRLVAQEYRAAQEKGTDPVLAVMCATGRSRRRSLRLIAQARDAGLLTARHARR
jgi:hypothetical protein